MNTHPFDNEVVLVNIVLGVDNYKYKPNIYIEPRKAENLHFRLHRPHEHNNFEFVEVQFEIITQTGQKLYTDKIIDMIGHIDLWVIEDQETTIEKVHKHNKAIMKEVLDSDIEKSDRAMMLLESYQNNYGDL